MTYDPAERAKEKQASRDRDEAALASGEKTREQLRRENGHFSFVGLRVDLAGCKSLGGETYSKSRSTLLSIEADKALRAGIDSAAVGPSVFLGSFAEYLDDPSPDPVVELSAIKQYYANGGTYATPYTAEELATMDAALTELVRATEEWGGYDMEFEVIRNGGEKDPA